MKIRFDFLDHHARRIVRACGRIADRKGVAVYLVGGVVRDLILKRPAGDLDFVAAGNADQLARMFARELKAKVTLYPRFGTARVCRPDGICVDFAAAREETYSRPGALPKVGPGRLHDDLFRRDFTVNTLAVSVNRGRWGQVVDVYNGLEDIRKKKIRVLHERGFLDDPTRILRAVRFSRRFGFAIETTTLRCLRRAVRQGALGTVSPERYFQEFRKILKECQPAGPLADLSRLGGIIFLKTETRLDVPVFKTLEKRILKLRAGPLYGREDFSRVYLMALAERMSARDLLHLISDLPLLREEKAALSALSAARRVWRRLKKMDLRPSAVFKLLRPLPSDAVLYLRTRYGDRGSAAAIDRFFVRDRFAALNITGRDLQRLGHSGRRVGQILENLLLAKIDGRLPDRRAQIASAERMVEEKDEGCSWDEWIN